MVIMGIDPGFAITGYGIVKYEGNRFSPIRYGVVLTDAGEPFAQRLLKLDSEISAIIEMYRPDAVAVEELFFNKNIKTAITAAHGRGISLAAAARCGVGVFEYTPLQVKQAVVGYGRADKVQVQQMVKAILNLPEIPKPDDAADALAIAICHGHSYKLSKMDYR
ncbi:MAG TPA: crossover junction endodeoxyribonuclease RuvC [Clostridiales bacterium]|nr:crossover junction endodeoxyribonuclease RuvC [Clostridiales bacterium]